MLRDRDAIYGRDFADITRDMGMEEVLTAPRSPWQNPFLERLVGSIRRECLDQVSVWNERSLRRTLQVILLTITDRERIIQKADCRQAWVLIRRSLPLSSAPSF